MLYSLKEELMGVGISENDIKSYIEMLKAYKENVQFGIKDVLIGILTFVTTNSLVTDYVKKIRIALSRRSIHIFLTLKMLIKP